MRHTAWLLFALAACGPSPMPMAGPAPLPALAGPAALLDTNADPKIVEVALTAAPAEVELTPGVRTRVLAYNGQVPGPLLQARVGDKVIVHFTNGLDEPTTVHWHGLRIDAAMDGSPMIQAPIKPGETFTYEFVVPDAGTFWYHPHLNTIQQLEKGLYGPLVVHDATPPPFTTERVVVLDDVKLDGEGQIARFLTSGPDVMHGRSGGTLLANGAEVPLRATAPRGAVERWRVINSAGSRTFTLTVEGARVRLIATDGGYLPEPVVPGPLELAAGQRIDLEVTLDGTSAPRLVASVLTAARDGTVDEVPVTLAEWALAGEVMATAPAYPTPALPDPGLAQLDHTYRIGADTSMGIMFTLNGHHGHELPIEPFKANVPVTLHIVNTLGMDHPFHLHGQFFQVVSRDGKPANEPGLKDTVLVHGIERVDVVTSFDNPGRWMIHCHIPEHGENGMMTELEVTE